MDELRRDTLQWVHQEMDQTAGHGWDHIQRVIRNGELLAAQEGADPLAVFLACAMHDVVNLAKDHPRRAEASTVSAEKAAAWLRGKVSDHQIELVYEAIRCHSYSAGFVPQSLEARVVSDADNLDAIGAIGIARAFECGGSMGTRLLSLDDPFCTGRAPDDRAFTVDHFYTKLLHLGDRFYTPSGHALAKRRLAFMKTFLSELSQEVSTQPPQTPSAMNTITTAELSTPLGPMIAGAVDEGICLLDFPDRRDFQKLSDAVASALDAAVVEGDHPHLVTLRRQLREYFEAARERFDLPLVMTGTDFQQRVWAGLLQIPFGETRSYKEQAQALDNPGAIRALGRANGANRMAILIPCHRVIASDGALTGYSGGLHRKRWLLDFEAPNARDQR